MQRWERSFALPVYRHAHHSAASVYAFREELDRWLAERSHLRAEATVADVEPAERERSDQRIVVLPFSDLSSDRRQKHICAGIVEELTCLLTGIEGITTPSPATVALEVSRSGPRAAPLRLGADLVVEGSVRQVGAHLRVTVRVTRQSDGQVLSSFHLNGTEAQTLAIQELLAQRVLRTLRAPVRGTQPPVRPRAPTVEVHDLCAMSRSFWNSRTPDSLRRSIALAYRALELDPESAQAHAALALGEISLANQGAEAPTDCMARARKAAQHAIALDPELPDAFVARGGVKIFFDWSPTAAAPDFERATELSPQHATTWQWHSLVHLANGDLADAVAGAIRAEELDPTSGIIRAHLAWMLYLAHRTDDALAACDRALRYDPKFARAYVSLQWVYSHQGRHEEALEAMNTCVALSDSLTHRAILARAQAAAGRPDLAQDTLAQLEANGQYVAHYFLAMARLELGDRSAALDQLRAALARREWFLLMARREPLFDRLRDDPAFEQVIAEVRDPGRRVVNERRDAVANWATHGAVAKASDAS